MKANILRGGGLSLYINEDWCDSICVKESLCTPDIELLTVSVRPYYLPPDAKKDNALQVLRDVNNRLADDKPDSLQIIFGDVNHCVKDLGPTCMLRGFEQCVTYPSRNQTMLDPFYCNITNSYKCRQLSPMGSSDHNMVSMLPKYKPKLKQKKPTKITKVIRNDISLEKMDDCFYLTDWDMFLQDAGGDVNILSDVVTSYITFCSDLHLERKEVKVFPNNKPWVTSDLRKFIVDKHKSYGKEDYRIKKKLLNDKIKSAKDLYKEKVEELFKQNNPKDAWKGLKVLTGVENERKEPVFLSQPGSADRLNHFYARFDKKDFSSEQQNLRRSLQNSSGPGLSVLSQELVKRNINGIKTQKAAGPDKINGCLLKACKGSLLYIIHKIFELSVATCNYPSCWNVGEIVPVSKKDRPKVDNDLRPVTLTAILSKCLEKVGLSLLMPYVEEHFDSLQFAYINGRSTEDAICTMVHRTTKHLDAKSTNTARALFIDYSSAFNTIQPHLMLEKLNNLNVPGYLQLWILDYLTGRPQYVQTSSKISGRIVLNTGASQGCVLSPILFVLYTNDLCWNSNTGCVSIVKYADDTIIVGIMSKEDDSEYMKCIKFVSTWCSDNFLDLNVSKTKEMIWDYRRSPTEKHPVVINDKPVKVTSVYK